MHGVVVFFWLMHQVAMLAGFHEAWVHIQVFEAALVTRAPKLVSIHKVWLFVL